MVMCLSFFYIFLGSAFAQMPFKLPENGFKLIYTIPNHYEIDRHRVRPPLTGAQILSDSKNSVFKLKLGVASGMGSLGHGTAFAIDAAGLLVTNFHVVVDALENPKKYNLSNEKLGPMSVVAIDPVNDLAILAVKSKLNSILSLSPENELSDGDTIYSLGYPRSEDLTMVSGTYNGTQVRGLASISAASIAINPGMSGGPSLDHYGRVIGVNRAIHRNAQSLSYLSPLSAIRALVEKAKNNPGQLKGGQWRSLVEEAIREQEALALKTIRLPALASVSHQKVGGFLFGIPIKGIECSQDFDRSENGVTKSEEIVCQSKGFAMVSGDIESLKLETHGGYTSSWISENPALRALLRSYKGLKKSLKTAAKLTESPQKKVKQKCELKNIKNRYGTKLVAQYCSMNIPHFSGIYSTFLRVMVRNKKGDDITIGQTYEGFTLDATIQLMTIFLESIYEESP